MRSTYYEEGFEHLPKTEPIIYYVKRTYKYTEPDEYGEQEWTETKLDMLHIDILGVHVDILACLSDDAKEAIVRHLNSHHEHTISYQRKA